MVLRRCPQCKNTTDDKYGFCLRCGYEYPDKQNNENINPNSENNVTCINCGYENPEEAEFCVKCGMPLIFNQHFENKNSPFIIKYEKSKPEDPGDYKKTSKITIILGYIFSILGGLIGLIFALYLVTRKDPVARKHGKIQLGIFLFYLILIGIALGTGMVTFEQLIQMPTMENMTSMKF